MVVIWSVWRVALPGGVQELTGTSRTTMCNCRGLKASLPALPQMGKGLERGWKRRRRRKVRVLTPTVPSARCQDLACNVLKINKPPGGTAHFTFRFSCYRTNICLTKCLLVRPRASRGDMTTDCKMDNEGSSGLTTPLSWRWDERMKKNMREKYTQWQTDE